MSPGDRSLCVILPALNEEATVAEVIGGIPRTIDGVSRIDVVVVDDGSTDATSARARAAGASVVRHPHPRGVGAAFHRGLAEALGRGADIIVNIDADGQFDPTDIPSLVRPVLDGKADLATCSRFKDPNLRPRMPLSKHLGNRIVARLVSSLVGTRFHDVACGFRALSRDAAMRLNLFGTFTYTQETFVDLAFKGLRIIEVPLHVRGERQFGQSRVASSLLRYGWNTSVIIFSTFKDYRPFAFFLGHAAILAAPAAVLGLFFLNHYVTTGGFSPHLWAGFTSAFLAFGAAVFVILAIAGESQQRLRLTMERILYLEKRQFYDRSPRDEAARD